MIFHLGFVRNNAFVSDQYIKIGTAPIKRLKAKFCFLTTGIITCLFRNDFSGPVLYSAELIDIHISHICQLLRCFLTSPAGTAINQYDLIFVRQLFRRSIGNTLIRNQDCSRNVSLCIFISPPDIYDNVTVIILHHKLGLVL